MDVPAVTRAGRAGFWKRGLLLLAGVFVVALAAVGVAVSRFHLPPPTGPYAVGTRILNLTDTSRHEERAFDQNARRKIVVQLWYPAEGSGNHPATYKRWRETSLIDSYESLLRTHSRWDAPVAKAGGAFPVLLFDHRWNGQRTQNTALAEDLASHGYVVAAIDHPYNSSRVMLDTGDVVKGTEAMEGPGGASASAEQRISFWNSTLSVWASDAVFVLNELAAKNADAGDPLHGRLDTDHAGAFGHSFGGAVSLRLCGLDPRIKAAVNLDGWTFGALASRNAAEPILILYEQESADRRVQLAHTPEPGTTQDQLDRADNAAVDKSLVEFGGVRAFVAGTQHLDFTDQPLLPPLHRGSFTGPIAPLRINTIMRESVLAFFDENLRGSTVPLFMPRWEYGDVTVETWPRSK